MTRQQADDTTDANIDNAQFSQLEVKLITLDAAAKLLSVSVRTVRRRIEVGELPAYRIGSTLVRVRMIDVTKLLKPIAPIDFN